MFNMGEKRVSLLEHKKCTASFSNEKALIGVMEMVSCCASIGIKSFLITNSEVYYKTIIMYINNNYYPRMHIESLLQQ